MIDSAINKFDIDAGHATAGDSVYRPLPGVRQVEMHRCVCDIRLAVRPEDDEDSLSARVQRLEHIIYPRAVGWYAAGRLDWRDGQALLDGRPPGPEIIEET